MMYALRILVLRQGVEFPTYSDYCGDLRKKKKVDKRSSDEIYDDIINQLRGR